MTFPTTGILDNFNRADGPLDGNWTAGFYGDSQGLAVIGNQAGSGNGSWAGSWWSAEEFGPDVEAYVTFAAFDPGAGDYPLLGFAFKVHGTVSGNFSGYYMDIRQTQFAIDKYTDGNHTGVAEAAALALAAGDSIGVSMVGDVITVYHKPAAGSWTVVATATDADYADISGFLAIEIQGAGNRLDNFGGGTYVPAAPAPEPVSATPPEPLVIETGRVQHIKLRGNNKGR